MSPKFINSLPVVKRVARRKFAWIAIISIQIFTLLAMFAVGIDRLPLLANLLEWHYTIMGSVIGAYMGFATLDNHLENKTDIEVAKVNQPSVAAAPPPNLKGDTPPGQPFDRSGP